MEIPVMTRGSASIYRKKRQKLKRFEINVQQLKHETLSHLKNSKLKVNVCMLNTIKVLFIIHEIIVSWPNRAGAEIKA